MKGKDNAATNSSRGRGINGGVCDYHASRSRFRRPAVKYFAIRRSQGDAAGIDSRCHLFQYRRIVSCDGSITAEFAMVLPIAVTVLAFGISLMAIQAARIQLIEFSALASRAIARGESDFEVKQMFLDQNHSASMDIKYENELVCVSIRDEKKIFWLGTITIDERQCARISGL